MVTVPLLPLSTEVSMDLNIVNRYGGILPPYRYQFSSFRVYEAQIRLKRLLEEDANPTTVAPPDIFRRDLFTPDDRALLSLKSAELGWVIRYILTALAFPKNLLEYRKTMSEADKFAALQNFVNDQAARKTEAGSAKLHQLSQVVAKGGFVLTSTRQTLYDLEHVVEPREQKNGSVVKAYWQLTVCTSEAKKVYCLSEEQAESMGCQSHHRLMFDYAGRIFGYFFGLTSREREEIEEEVERSIPSVEEEPAHEEEEDPLYASY